MDTTAPLLSHPRPFASVCSDEETAGVLAAGLGGEGTLLSPEKVNQTVAPKIRKSAISSFARREIEEITAMIETIVTYGAQLREHRTC